MGLNLLGAVQGGAGTALQLVGEQIQKSANPSTGVVPAPALAPTPAGTYPASSVSAAPPTGNAAQGAKTYAVPVWVWVVGGVAAVALVVVLVRSMSKGA
jgi:hypothetical protein